MSKMYDVIIAGAGPVGLFLACELGLAGTSVLVLERDVKPDDPWKSYPLGRRGLNTVSVEGFYRRGLLDKFFDPDQRPSSFQKKPGFQFGGHFAGIVLDANKLDLSRHKYRLNGPALVPGPTTIDRLEKVLSERAESLGVTILRGNGFGKIVAEDNHGVTVETSRKEQFQGRWLVGCDGGRSAVRHAVNIDFIGAEPKFTGYVVQCDFDHPERLKMGFHPTKTGLHIAAGPDNMYLIDFDNASFDRTQEITKEHLQDVFERVSGVTDVKITKVHIANSLTDRTKQAAHYRKGRVLLAGDAAHIHSPLGAQGLNLGLGDAMNLGWKLATTVRQESNGSPSDLALLDTYETERHPIGAWVLEWTRAQVSALEPNAHGVAVQNLIRDLINTTDGNNLFIDRVWGLSQRYKTENNDKHELIGSSAPDFEFIDGSRLGSKLERAKGLLVDFEGNKDLQASLGEQYEKQVTYTNLDAKDKCCLRALLIRPDGIVAWAADDSSEKSLDINTAKAALEHWFLF